MTVVVIDYGVGNLGAIPNMLARIGVDATVTRDPEVVAGADRIILPGVGAFDAGMEHLRSGKLLPVLEEQTLRRGVPTLGLCLGMQLLFESSEEGGQAGLGWLPGKVIRFDTSRFTERLTIPHMGWNDLDIVRPSPLLAGLTDPRFYFAHSYHPVAADESDVVATTTHGYPFAACVERGNIAGAQFHPEKSHRFGLRFLANFVGAAP